MMPRTHGCLCAATSVAPARTKSIFIISQRPCVPVRPVRLRSAVVSAAALAYAV